MSFTNHKLRKRRNVFCPSPRLRDHLFAVVDTHYSTSNSDQPLQFACVLAEATAHIQNDRSTFQLQSAAGARFYVIEVNARHLQIGYRRIRVLAHPGCPRKIRTNWCRCVSFLSFHLSPEPPHRFLKPPIAQENELRRWRSCFPNVKRTADGVQPENKLIQI